MKTALAQYADVPPQPGVYRLWVGDRYYYGQAKNLRGRARDHRSALINDRHHNPRVQRAYAIEKTAQFEPLALCEIPELDRVEGALIARDIDKPRCMNLGTDPVAPQRGRKASAETRRKIGDAQRGRPTPPEVRARMTEAAKGRVITMDQRLKLREANLGAKSPVARPVWAVSPAGAVYRFDTQTEASVFLGYRRSATVRQHAKNGSRIQRGVRRGWFITDHHPGESRITAPSPQTQRGSKIGQAKLTEAKVIEIRRALAAGATGAELGRQHNVSRGTISGIRTRKTWTHVQD